MIKKIIGIIICLFLLVGCSNANNMSYEEIINDSISTESTYTNINNKGYKYYIPSEFTVVKDDEYIQELLSNGYTYYLNIDVVSYYYKNDMTEEKSENDYYYYVFKNEDKSGYLRIEKNNDKFFVELCYNYAIIEVEVIESELRYAISRGISILNSIEYNDLVIENYIVNNDLDSSETIYTIPEPKNKDENKNILEYIDETENEDSNGEEDTSDNM